MDEDEGEIIIPSTTLLIWLAHNLDRALASQVADAISVTYGIEVHVKQDGRLRGYYSLGVPPPVQPFDLVTLQTYAAGAITGYKAARRQYTKGDDAT